MFDADNENENEKVYTATYKEIIIGFIIFSTILVLLYSNNTMEKQVLNENVNYDLSMLYLKDMLKQDPNNETIMLGLAQQAYKSNKMKLYRKLIARLKESKNIHIRSKVYALMYKVNKEQYYYLIKDKKEKELKEKYAKLQNIFKEIMKANSYQDQDIFKLYQESLFLNDKNSSYILAQQLTKTRPDDIKVLRDTFYLSYNAHHYKKSIGYLKELLKKDKQNHEKWLDEAYYVFSAHESYSKTESFLKEQAQHSSKWNNRLISFYLQHKKYKKAADLYMYEFNKSNNFTQKEKLWTKAIRTLQAGAYYKDAVNLGYKYENTFIRDKKARIMLLKLYISANDTQKANMLSDKLLRLKR